MNQNNSEPLILSVTDFVAVFNQTIEYAYPQVAITGELANFRVSKNRWVYFDLKDEYSSVKFFGTVYTLPGPLEDGMLLQVRGAPRLHPQFGFSVTFDAIQPVGEGTIRRASDLLEAKLRAEGLFDEDRKRSLPYPPRRIALVASGESAAYHDFMKILNHRWGGVDIEHADVQVQGESAPAQIVAALERLNTESDAEVIVMTRGGGSPEDLAAFSHELVVRAVAASRIPTLVAIGHEVDISLSELAADRRASTPSNAAEMLVPDKKHELQSIQQTRHQLMHDALSVITDAHDDVMDSRLRLSEYATKAHITAVQTLQQQANVLGLLNPQTILKRGYALIQEATGGYVYSIEQLRPGQDIQLQLHDGAANAKVLDSEVE